MQKSSFHAFMDFRVALWSRLNSTRRRFTQQSHFLDAFALQWRSAAPDCSLDIASASLLLVCATQCWTRTDRDPAKAV